MEHGRSDGQQKWKMKRSQRKWVEAMEAVKAMKLPMVHLLTSAPGIQKKLTPPTSNPSHGSLSDSEEYQHSSCGSVEDQHFLSE